MAITQALLAEEILTRSERAVVRKIYQASQMTEAINNLGKIADVLVALGISNNPSATKLCDHVKSYLASEVVKVLVSIKIPSLKTTGSESSVPAEQV